MSDMSLRVFYSLEPDDLQSLICRASECNSSFDSSVDFWLTFLRILYQSFNFFCVSDALIYVQTLINFNLRSYTLKHILVYPLVLQYFVIIKTLEALYKSIFFSTRVFLMLLYMFRP